MHFFKLYIYLSIKMLNRNVQFLGQQILLMDFVVF